MTVTFDLPPQVERAYREEANAKGVQLDALVREVLIARHPAFSGADLIAAMQASPFREIELQPASDRLPVRDVTF
jgi:hypothetical protein